MSWATKVKGYSLVETMVAMLIASISLLTGSYLVGRTARQHDMISKQVKDATDQLLLVELLGRAVQALDSHRIPLLPVVHPRGRITFFDGTPVAGLHDASPASDALSYAFIEAKYAQVVESCYQSADGMVLRACLSGPAPKSFRDVDNLLLLSPEGMALVPGTIRGAGKCRTIFVSGAKSLLTAQLPSPSSCSVRVATPVRSVETLYLTASGTLKLVRYRGANIIERQPIATPNFALRLALGTDPANGLSTLNVDFIRENSPPSSSQLSHSLGRRHFLDLVFNL